MNFNEYFTQKYVKKFKRLKPLSRKTYFDYLIKYFSLYGKDFSSENVKEFLQTLPKSTRAKALFALKHYAKHNDIEFDVAKEDFDEDFWYQFYDRKVRPLTKEEVEKFIKCCFNGKYDKKESAAVLLFATYGLRRIELAKLNPLKDISISDRRILIKTAKKGRARYHYIPNVLLPFLSFLQKHNVRYSLNYLSATKFRSLCKRAGVVKDKQLGWHAFRRALVTELLNLGFPEGKIYDFLRWSRKEIIYRYYLPDPKIIDQEVFEVHPFLPIIEREFKKKVKPVIILNR